MYAIRKNAPLAQVHSGSCLCAEKEVTSDLAEDKLPYTLDHGEMRPNITHHFLVSGSGWDVCRYLNVYCEHLEWRYDSDR